MNTKDNILKQIFFDENHNWDNFVKLHPKSIRKIVLKEVEKFRLCGEKEAGFSLYACEYCGEIKIVPPKGKLELSSSCKGRFCSVCATGYMQEWSKKTAENMYNMPHRHILCVLKVFVQAINVLTHYSAGLVGKAKEKGARRTIKLIWLVFNKSSYRQCYGHRRWFRITHKKFRASALRF